MARCDCCAVNQSDMVEIMPVDSCRQISQCIQNTLCQSPHMHAAIEESKLHDGTMSYASAMLTMTPMDNARHMHSDKTQCTASTSLSGSKKLPSPVD